MPLHRVLLVTTTLDIGGEQLSTLALARGLLRRGHFVRWWTAGGPLEPEVRQQGVPLLEAPPEGRGLKGLSYVLCAAGSLRRAIAREKVDIVHCQTLVPVLSAALARIGPEPRPRLLLHNRGLNRLTYRLVGRPLNCLADFVICNSHYERGLLVRHGLRPERCRTIHNCMYADVNWTAEDRAAARQSLGLAADQVAVGVIGRLSWEKGHRYLLEAVARLRPRFPHLRLLIVGGGPLQKRLVEQSRALGLERCTVFTGFRRDLRAIYAAADIVAVPSLMEPFGNVAIEAMAASKPLVATRVGGLVEAVVAGKTGLLVSPADASALARALGVLLDDPHLARQLAQAGREHVMSYFTLDRVIDEVQEVYDSLTGRAPATALAGAATP